MAHSVPNLYKEALQRIRPGVGGAAADLHDALDAAQRAMAAGAWRSTAATDFEHVLSAHRTLLRSTADAALQELAGQIWREDDLVAPTSWQAHYGLAFGVVRAE